MFGFSALLKLSPFIGFFQVKYLGEDGVNVPIVGAAAICSPWDSLVSIL